MVSSPVACGDGEENLGLQTTETGFETLEKHGFNLFQVTEIIVWTEKNHYFYGVK